MRLLVSEWSSRIARVLIERTALVEEFDGDDLPWRTKQIVPRPDCLSERLGQIHMGRQSSPSCTTSSGSNWNQHKARSKFWSSTAWSIPRRTKCVISRTPS